MFTLSMVQQLLLGYLSGKGVSSVQVVSAVVLSIEWKFLTCSHERTQSKSWGMRGSSPFSFFHLFNLSQEDAWTHYTLAHMASTYSILSQCFPQNLLPNVLKPGPRQPENFLITKQCHHSTLCEFHLRWIS